MGRCSPLGHANAMASGAAAGNDLASAFNGDAGGNDDADATLASAISATIDATSIVIVGAHSYPAIDGGTSP